MMYKFHHLVFSILCASNIVEHIIRMEFYKFLLCLSPCLILGVLVFRLKSFDINRSGLYLRFY